MLTENLTKVQNIAGISINITVEISKSHSSVALIVNNQYIMVKSKPLETIENLLQNATTISNGSNVYVRHKQKSNRWQHYDAIEYENAGGENTYSSYSDEEMLKRFEYIQIHEII